MSFIENIERCSLRIRAGRCQSLADTGYVLHAGLKHSLPGGHSRYSFREEKSSSMAEDITFKKQGENMPQMASLRQQLSLNNRNHFESPDLVATSHFLQLGLGSPHLQQDTCTLVAFGQLCLATS